MTCQLLNYLILLDKYIDLKNKKRHIPKYDYYIFYAHPRGLIHPEKYMKQNHPSLTAYKVAMMRAAHQVLDDPKVFDDPMALSVVGTQGVSAVFSERKKFKKRLSVYLRAIVVARSRFVEDELSQAVKRGIR